MQGYQKIGARAKPIEHRTLDGSIAGAILFVISFLQSIILVPVFLKFWGSEKYGLWVTVYAFINLMRTLDLGYQNFVGNEFNKLYHQSQLEAKKLLGSSMRMSYLLGAFELLVYLVILAFGWQKNTMGVGPGSYNISPGVISLLVMWMLVGSFGGVLVRIIMPLGLYSRSLYLSVVVKITELITIATCVYLKSSINILCFFLSVVWLSYSAFIFYDIRRIIPEFYPWWRHGNFSYGLKLFSRSLVLTVNNIVDQFSTNGILIVVSNIIGVFLVPVFTTLRTVANTFTQATTIIITPVTPDIVRFYVKGEIDNILTVIKANWFLSNLIVNVPFIILTPFIESIFTWWTKGMLQFNYPLYCTLTLSVSMINFGKGFVTTLSSINHLRALSIITCSRFIIIFAVGIPLLKVYGLSGLGWSFVIAELVCSILIPIYFIRKIIGERQLYFDYKQLLVSFLPTLILGLYYFLLHSVPRQFLSVIILACVGGILYWQWNHMSPTIRTRITSMSKKYFYFFKTR